MLLEMGLAEHDEFYDLSVSRGYSMNRSKSEFRLEALRRNVNLMAQDEEMAFEALDELDRSIMAGEGDYAGLDVSEREQLSGILSGKMGFLEREALVDTQAEYDNAMQTLKKPMISAIETNEASQQALASIARFRKLGQPQKARELELDFRVTNELSLIHI